MSDKITFKQLVERFSWKQVAARLIELYPTAQGSLKGYKKVFAELKKLEPTATTVRLCVANTPPDDIEPEWGIDVHGKDGTRYKDDDSFLYYGESWSEEDANKEQHWAIEFRRWEEWLGMEVDKETLKAFEPLDIVCHSLYEMTFCGYSQEEVQGEWKEIEHRKDEYDNMSEEEKKKHMIPWEEAKEQIEDAVKQIEEKKKEKGNGKA